MRTPKTALAVLAILAAGAGLTGCSVGFTPDGSSPERAPSMAAATTSEAAEPTDDAATTDSTDAATDDGRASGVGVAIAAVREQVGSAVNAVSCPGGTLDVSSTGTIVSLDGPCENLTVSGTGAIVFAKDVGTLTVAAAGAVVSVDTAKTVTITDQAVGVVVGWSTGTPTVTDAGTSSVVGATGQE